MAKPADKPADKKTAATKTSTANTAERTPLRAVRGIVVSDKMDKTCVIEIQLQTTHKLYHKKIWKRHRFFVHDEKNQAKTGDTILAINCRPLSKNKTLRLQQVVQKGVRV